MKDSSAFESRFVVCKPTASDEKPYYTIFAPHPGQSPHHSGWQRKISGHLPNPFRAPFSSNMRVYTVIYIYYTPNNLYPYNVYYTNDTIRVLYLVNDLAPAELQYYETIIHRSLSDRYKSTVPIGRYNNNNTLQQSQSHVDSSGCKEIYPPLRYIITPLKYYRPAGCLLHSSKTAKT